MSKIDGLIHLSLGKRFTSTVVNVNLKQLLKFFVDLVLYFAYLLLLLLDVLSECLRKIWLILCLMIVW